ncbi:MAG: hypothetical protein KJZ98_15355 [Burkholderiaceae bacterium]|jgi:hypothetical protein|nr:hypothetical protein [Burkholderiaceae bacterium]MEB2352741.1 hypothetical protein [Burkholderiaceae bacterium]
MSLDLLRLWHERIEAWILAEAGIEAPKGQAASGGLRALNVRSSNGIL